MITRTWKTSDCVGNTATCAQMITVSVNDTQQPALTCPPNVTVECGSSTAPSATGFPIATDDCQPVPVLSFSDSEVTLTCPNVRRITRTWTAADCANNTRSCTQTITVRDTTAPIASCPPNVTAQCFASVPPPDFLGGTTTDNCGTPVVTHVKDVALTNNCVITITRTYRTRDACGNTNDCTQTITVRDTTPPVIACPPSATVPCISSAPPTSRAFLSPWTTAAPFRP